MPNTRKPRSGSMQFWPRVRAKHQVARVRSWANVSEAKPLGFAGYKAGMTHVIAPDSRKNSVTKGMKLRIPVTIIECPKLKIIGARFYKKSLLGENVAGEIEFKSDNKKLSKRKNVSKHPKQNLDAFADKLSDYSSIRLVVHTMPDKTSIGKKVPEVFEMGLGGSVEDQFAYLKENQGSEFSLADTFQPGELIDLRGVSIGKGTQGPVKRFGVKIRSHKSEKTKRGPGSIAGGWVAHGHMMPRVAFAGQTGYHARTEYNKLVMKISDNPEEVNPRGGFINYGEVKNDFLIVKGSVLGPKKRLIRFNKALRPSKRLQGFVPALEHISLESRQR